MRTNDTHMTWITSRCLLLLLALSAAGCAASLKPPANPVPPSQTFAYEYDNTTYSRTQYALGRYPGGLKIDRVLVTGEGDVSTEDKERFGATLKRYLEQAYPRRDQTLPPIHADVIYDANYTARRTFVLDGYALLTFGLLPLTPQWGKARTRARLILRLPPVFGIPGNRATLYRTAASSYTIMAYSWFRTAPIEEAFKFSHNNLWFGLVHGLDRWIARNVGQSWARFRKPPAAATTAASQPASLPAAVAASQPTSSPESQPAPPAAEPAPPPQPDQPDELVAAAASDPTTLPPLTPLNLWDWRVVTEATLEEFAEHGVGGGAQPYWKRYLKALSGLEVGFFAGGAWVSSSAVDADGNPFTIASGKATSRGWKLTFFNPPDKSEWFIYPTLGFFSLDIDIADMAADIPLGGKGVIQDARDIPAIATDVDSGEAIDLSAPNVFALKLRSGYVGQRAGGTLVYGHAKTQLFLTLEGGVNLFEVRYTDVTLGNSNEDGYSAIFLHSFAGRALVGFVHRPWHMALRCEGNWEFYRQFAFPEPQAFRSKVTYNEAIDKHEREVIRVDAAAVHTANFFCGASLVY